MRFNLRRLFAVVAIYAVLFGLMRPLGTAGTVLACLSATALGGVAAIARTKDVVPVVWVVSGAFVGALLADLILQPFILVSFYGYDHGFGETAKSSIAATIIGVVGGSVLFSWLARWDRRFQVKSTD